MESILILMEWNLYLNNRYYLVLTLSLTCDLMIKCPRGGERGQNLEQFRFFFIFALDFLECNCQFKHQVLFRNDFLSVNSDCMF